MNPTFAFFFCDAGIGYTECSIYISILKKIVVLLTSLHMYVRVLLV